VTSRRKVVHHDGPCACGACRSAWIRRAWAEGKFARRRAPAGGVRGDVWTDAQRERLQQLAGHIDARAIATVLSREFPETPRTRHGVHLQAHKMGLSLWQPGRSLEEVGALFGLHAKHVRQWWVGTGLLEASVYEKDRTGGVLYRVSDQALSTFVKTHTWAYVAARMRAGDPLAALARVYCARPVWLDVDQLARIIGCRRSAVTEAIRSSGIPHKRRLGYRRGLDLLVHVDQVEVLRAAVGAVTREQTREWRELKRAQRGHVAQLPEPVLRFEWTGERHVAVRVPGAGEAA
jgi:hypothetical protein